MTAQGLKVDDYLQQASLLRLLAVMALVIAPHVTRIPWWESALVGAVLIWRALASIKQWRLPPAWIKIGITLLAFAAVQSAYGRTQGQAAGVALFVAMMVLKLLEMRQRRDVMITVFLMYFLLLTHFLYSQELWTIVYLGLCVTAITAVLIEASHPRAALPPRVTLRFGLRFMAQAVPLMIVMFVLFPRIPGPLWGLPTEGGGASGRSGLSDSMAPGDIANLILSDEIAFRVEFQDPVPARGQLYWRGPSFEYFDGRGWSQGFSAGNRQPPQALRRGSRVRYAITMEPNGRRWMMALDIPAASTLPIDSALAGDFSLLSRRRINDRRLYELASYPDYVLQPELNDRLRRVNTQLPDNSSPRTRELMDQWRAEGLDDVQMVNRALRRFREQQYVYTLQPPGLGPQPVDEFLFETLRGFCEHYASAFTVMMRAADIPARVVTGYQGGEKNEIGDHYVVRQSDAHAWTEVWLPERGWLRMDPTAAVAPNRIELGLQSALSAAEGLPGYLSQRLRAQQWLEARWELANAVWNKWVLGYGPELQQEFLRRFGIKDWGQMILLLTIILTGGMAIFGLLILRQSEAGKAQDAAAVIWRKAEARLGKLGYSRAAHEGPQDFVERVCAERPDWAPMLQRLLRHYLQQRYLGSNGAEELQQLQQALRALNLRPAGH